jgi:hypothetical protein
MFSTETQFLDFVYALRAITIFFCCRLSTAHCNAWPFQKIEGFCVNSPKTCIRTFFSAAGGNLRFDFLVGQMTALHGPRSHGLKSEHGFCLTHSPEHYLKIADAHIQHLRRWLALVGNDLFTLIQQTAPADASDEQSPPQIFTDCAIRQPINVVRIPADIANASALLKNNGQLRQYIFT